MVLPLADLQKESLVLLLGEKINYEEAVTHCIYQFGTHGSLSFL